MSADVRTRDSRRGAAAGQLAQLGSPPLLLRLIGAGLLFATAGLHLDLYLTGYRTIPTIGWLFLLQVIAGFGLGLMVLVSRSRLVAAAGALFALATLGGYLLSVQFGLFGFREIRTTAGIVAGLIEVVAFGVLAAYALLAGAAAAAGPPSAAATAGRHAARRPIGFQWLSRPPARASTAAIAVVGVVALALLGGALAGAPGAAAGSSTPGQSGSSTPAASGTLRTARIGGATVLTNASGRTLYWFARDTPTKSACYGSCAGYWPPVAGPLRAGPGVTGTLGTIHRTGGMTQETYDGHPLYTYIADSGPGQAHGNNLNLNGGLWHEMLVSG
jgi:predicted lipoprotein with Yx(FWY)xxD motif